MSSEVTIYLVDDDDAVRKTLTRSLSHSGYEVKAYDSGKSFLEEIEPDIYGCVLLDVAMPLMSGMEVQTELNNLGCEIPIIFMTGHGDVQMSVRAIKSGAIEFLEKPFAIDLMLERIEEALELDKERRTRDQATNEVQQRFDNLTKREVDVMAGLVAGLADRSNKEVARELEISHRTVEEYRARIMKKMSASSITHLVEMAKACGVYRAET